jgi:hypothetical protein
MTATAAALCRILEQWALEGGELPKLLSEYVSFTIHTEAEVRAICTALDRIHNTPPTPEEPSPTALMTLTHLLSNAESEEAKEAVVDEGLTVLRWFVSDANSGKPHREEEILPMLEVFAVYQQKEDVQWIYKAILKPIAAQSKHWYSILSHFRKDTPYSRALIQGLAKHIPRETACLAFLDLCNHAFEEGWVQPHAFECEAGLAKLAKYLHPQSQRQPEYARAAAQSLKYLSSEHRGPLEQLASQHPDPIVSLQIVIERAAAGDESQRNVLMERCKDVRASYLTQQCMERSGLALLIPSESKDPNFLILAEMAYWLATSSDYQTAPDSLERIDSRTLFWPPDHQNKTLHLVRYHYEHPPRDLPAQGIGLVGSRVGSLIGESQPEMPPEDLYGLHCCWEMEQAGDPLAPRNRTAKTGRNLLRRGNPGF